MSRLLRDRGAVLFRGFPIASPAALETLVTEGLGWEPWNSFNEGQMPGFMASLARTYFEGLVGGGDYRRYLDANVVQLGPVRDSVQGPHVEGGMSAKRARNLALCCFEPAPSRAETGLADLRAAYAALPEAARQKYRRASNRFFYVTQRKLRFWDHWMLRKAPFRVRMRADGRGELLLSPCPLVCTQPETELVCPQPWAFARNTVDAALDAARTVFTGRGRIDGDHSAAGMDLSWSLQDEDGNPIDWSPDEQRTLFEAIYRRATLVSWQKNDVLLVDNLRMAHWRMNGEQGLRKLVQIQANTFDANLL